MRFNEVRPQEKTTRSISMVCTAVYHCDTKSLIKKKRPTVSKILWFQAVGHLSINHNITVPGINVISLSELDFDPRHPNIHISKRK
jgi:hypothetical protein